MRVVIAHNAVPPNARADESDVLVQVEQVRAALVELGHSYEIVAVDLNLQACANQLRESQPDVVFNLIESLEGSDRLVSLAVAVIETLGLPLTGSSAQSLWLTNHKILTKQRFKLAGLPTPEWLDPEDGACWAEGRQTAARIQPGDRFILKPDGEHASLGMDESAIVRPRDFADLAVLTRRYSEKLGRQCFAEQFISGREFNVSLLADAESCQVLPLAEIDFSAFPPDKPRIVDYKAKWDVSSFEFQHTPRRFLECDAEPLLSQRLSELARDCWSVFQLGGYARVDFRLDEAGRPWILEINTNPCLSPDAGFVASLQQAKIGFSLAVKRILADALRKQRTKEPVTMTTDNVSSVNRDSLSTATSPSGSSSDGAAAARRRGDDAITWRFEVTEGDSEIIRDLVAKTGFFYPDEVAVAEELVQERVAKGAASGYHFVLAEIGGQVAGYASYGHIACTRDSYDLYWIAVHPRHQGQGIGRLILEEAERCIRAVGGRRVYIETSNREQYQSTRGFYLRCGYECEATLAEFYGPGDDKVIYVKALA